MKLNTGNRSTSNNNKYVPPTKSYAPTTNLTKTTAAATVPSTSYKEDFPTLLNTKNLKSNNNNAKKNNQKEEVFSFASALNNEKKAEKITIIDETTITTTLPGWVSIKRIDGKINYQYGIMTDAYVNMLLEKQKYEKRLDKIYFKRRLDQLQWERDIQNDLLGDLSPYWGKKPLNELYRHYNNSLEDDYDAIAEEEDTTTDSCKKREEEEVIWTYVL